MKKLLITLAISAIALIASTKPVNAELKYAGQSAKIYIAYAEAKQDNRVSVLRRFFEAKNSPLADHAETFVKEADKYNLDWKLVAAISGTESSFGIHYPYGTYNGWGWGIYGNNMHYFKSWDDAIATISKGLRERYMNKWGAKDVYGIGRFYASNPAWANHTVHFMNMIERFENESFDNSLSLSL